MGSAGTASLKVTQAKNTDTSYRNRPGIRFENVGKRRPHGMVPNSLSGILTGAGSGSRTWFYLLPTKHTKGADGEKRPVRLEPAVSPSDQPRKAEPHIPSGITPGMTRGTACRVYARPSGGDANIAPPPCAPRRPVLRGIRAARYRRKSYDEAGQEVNTDYSNICRGWTRTAMSRRG